MDVTFGVRHQPEDVTLSAADARDVASGAVGIVGIGNLFYAGKICSGYVLPGIEQGHLPIHM